MLRRAFVVALFCVPGATRPALPRVYPAAALDDYGQDGFMSEILAQVDQAAERIATGGAC